MKPIRIARPSSGPAATIPPPNVPSIGRLDRVGIAQKGRGIGAPDRLACLAGRAGVADQHDLGRQGFADDNRAADAPGLMV
jgi:hypothetical protein